MKSVSKILASRAGVVAAGAVAFVAFVGLPVSSAHAVDVTSACASDYSRYCNAYGVGTAQLKRCMESNRRSLSRRCINALVDSGQVPRKQARRR